MQTISRWRIAAFLLSFLLPWTLEGCWYLGDPSAYMSVLAYAPKQSIEDTALTVDKLMETAGYEVNRVCTQVYYVQNKQVSYDSYEKEFCQNEAVAGKSDCLARFIDYIGTKPGNEPRREGKIAMSYAIPGSHLYPWVSIENHKGGSVICMTFWLFGVSEFDDSQKSEIARLRATMVGKFGYHAVSNTPCYQGQELPYFPG